jgi:hypothetical protein
VDSIDTASRVHPDRADDLADFAQYDTGLRRPRSAVSVWTGLVGLVGLVVAMVLQDALRLSTTQTLDLMLVLPAALMVGYELAVSGTMPLRAARETDWPATLQRTGVKLIGIWTAWLVVAFIYKFLPYYDQPGFSPLYAVLGLLAPYLFIASVPYVLLVDRLMPHPYDENWHFGMLILGQWQCVDIGSCRHHVLNYAIKGFFIAFMYRAYVANGVAVLEASWSDFFRSPLVFYSLSLHYIYLIDVIFGTIGYVLTLKLLDSHIRSPNPFLLGWLVAFCCYPPFIIVGDGRFLTYYGAWENVISPNSPFGLCLIIAIVLLTAIYGWATVAFGIRFSNLTHRGIITNGPYAFSKHPAYICKNIAWWLMSIPFIPLLGVEQTIGSCLSLCIVNVVYYLRAKTEEAHLSQDPIYVEYAAYIARHGIVAKVNHFGRSIIR